MTPEITATRQAAPDGSITEKRILEVATELFYERGYHATTMREIAAGVGIKAGSLYNHFTGKQDMLVRIGQESTRPLYAGAIARLEGVDDVEDQLRTLIGWHVEYHCVNRLQCRVIDTQLHALDNKNRKAIVQLRDEYESLLRGILDRGQKEGRWDIADIGVVAIAIATMCTEVDAWYREGGRLTPEALGELLADFVRQGLGPAPKTKSRTSKSGRSRSTRKESP